MEQEEADREERAQEMEALEAIFGSDLQRISDDTFSLSLLLPENRRITLHCHLPSTYPSSTAPLFQLQADWLSASVEVCTHTYTHTHAHTHTHTHTHKNTHTHTQHTYIYIT